MAYPKIHFLTYREHKNHMENISLEEIYSYLKISKMKDIRMQFLETFRKRWIRKQAYILPIHILSLWQS